MKRFLTILLITLAAIVAGAIFAQEQTTTEPPAQEELEPLSNFVETIDIRIVNVDIVVTDKKGNPITGLKKGDFELYDNGRLQPLSNFYEVKGRAVIEYNDAGEAFTEEITEETPTEDIPKRLQRRYIFFVDNLSLAPFNRRPVFDAMKDFIDENLVPGDLGMIATFNRDLHISVPFTDDHMFLKQNLDRISEENSFGLQNLTVRRQVEERIRQSQDYEEAISEARSYAYEVEHDLRTAAAAMKSLMSTLAGVEGKKVMVVTTEGFPIQPGRELFYYIDELANQKGWRSSSSTYMEAAHFNSKTTIESMGQSANAHGITLYTLHAGGLSAGSAGASAEQSSPIPQIVSTAALTNSTESMNMLAYMTGGKATVGSNNFKLAFDTIESDLGAYYSLGYRSGSERVDRQRRIEVKVKGDNKYRVRYRRSFVEKSVFTELSDRVVANLFYKSDDNILNIRMKTGRARAVEEDRYIVPVELQIPLEGLGFIPTGEVVRGGFRVFIVVADERGDMSEIEQRQESFVLERSELESIAGRHYTYTMDLLMGKGRNKISMAVLDDSSNLTGYTTQEVLALDLR